MKKILFILVMLVPTLLRAQEIKISDSKTDKSRTITAYNTYGSQINLYNNSNGNMSGVAPFALMATFDLKQPKKVEYALSFPIWGMSSRAIAIDKGARLLLKSGNENNVCLTCLTSQSPQYGGTEGYDMNCVYSITKSQLTHLLNQDSIPKMRMEFTTKQVDVRFPKNELYIFLKIAYKTIEETISSSDSFTKDF